MKRTEQLLDDLVSEFVRRRAMARVGGCERCLTPKFDKQKEDGTVLPAWRLLQCAHYLTRSKFSIRWDEDNVFGFCGACHIYFQGRGEEFAEWVKQQLGQAAFDMLKGRERNIGKPDVNALIIYYRHKILKLVAET